MVHNFAINHIIYYFCKKIINTSVFKHMIMNINMKKIIFLFAMIGTCLSVSAQQFEPQVRLTGEFGIDDDKNTSLGFDFVAGIRVNDMLRVGVGTGISYCEHLYTYGYREPAAYIPIFLNGKVNFIKSGISPYLNLDLGVPVFIPFSEYAKEQTFGFFIRPAFGMDFPLSGKGRIFVEIGYKFQKREVGYMNRNYNQISCAVGYSF